MVYGAILATKITSAENSFLERHDHQVKLYKHIIIGPSDLALISIRAFNYIGVHSLIGCLFCSVVARHVFACFSPESDRKHWNLNVKSPSGWHGIGH